MTRVHLIGVPDLVPALRDLGLDETAAGNSDVLVVLGDPERVRAAVADAGLPALALAPPPVDRARATLYLDAGASGVVDADATPERIATAATAVAAGLLVLPPSARESVRRGVLTARQQQIAGLLVLGLPNAEIAARMHLSEHMVKSHVRGVLTALGVRSRAEAVDVLLDPAQSAGQGVISLHGRAGRRGYTPPRVS